MKITDQKGNITLRYRLHSWWRGVVARHDVRAHERANVRAGNYTNGEPMTEGDRTLYHYLTIAAAASILFIALLIGVIIGITT